MIDENNPQDNSQDPPSDDTPPELVLDDVVSVEPDNLSDEQKTFLEENKADLTDEQAEKFDIKKESPDDDTPPEDEEIETRTKKKSTTDVDKPDPEDEEIDPNDEKTINKIVDKRMKKLTEDLGVTRDQVEVNDFIRDNPDHAKYRKAMLKHVSHPAYKDIPIHNIAAIVSSKDQQKLGAHKEREAARKAEETKGGGSTARKSQGKVNWHTASKEQFEAEKQRVLGRQGQ